MQGSPRLGGHQALALAARPVRLSFLDAALVEADDALAGLRFRLPHDIAAEQAVLGSMMLLAEAVADVCAVITAADYYRPAYQVVHNAVTDMHARGAPADPVSLVDELRA